MPDIDIDFCMNRRGEVIEYVTAEVRPRAGGADHHLRHHGARKAAIKDVGRALDMPYADVDRIAKMVPTTLEHHARRGARQNRRRLQEAYEKDPQVRELIDTAHEAGRPGAQLPACTPPAW